VADEIFKKYALLFLLVLSGCFYNPPVVTTTSEPQVVHLNKKSFEPLRAEAKDWSSDPFESKPKLELTEIPAKRISVTFPETKLTPHQQSKLPLPDFQYGLTGIMFNGSISAVLETQIGNKVLHNYVSPGALIPTNDENIPYLMVDSITTDNLVLKSPDGRTTNVSLSGVPPDVLNDLKSKFN
jgi:hypothetical protein